MRLKINHFFLALLSSVSFLSCKTESSQISPSQIEKDVHAIDSYLYNDKTSTIVYHSTGIRLVVHTTGTGLPPHSGQSVNLSFTEKLFPGHKTVTDSGTYSGLLNNLLTQGLMRGIATLPEGSTATIYVPSDYAYGSNGAKKVTTNVPPNSIIEYNVTLNNVTKTATELTQFKADTAAIHQYLISKNINNAISDPSGIWYTVDTAGTGTKPTVFNRITANYTGKLLSTGTVFANNLTLTNQALYDLIDGLKVGISQTLPGSTVTIYIPSGLGYGVNGNSGSIPANANLIFQIKLKSVTKL